MSRIAAGGVYNKPTSRIAAGGVSKTFGALCVPGVLGVNNLRALLRLHSVLLKTS